MGFLCSAYSVPWSPALIPPSRTAVLSENLPLERSRQVTWDKLCTQLIPLLLRRRDFSCIFCGSDISRAPSSDLLLTLRAQTPPPPIAFPAIDNPAHTTFDKPPMGFSRDDGRNKRDSLVELAKHPCQPCARYNGRLGACGLFPTKALGGGLDWMCWVRGLAPPESTRNSGVVASLDRQLGLPP